MRKYGLFILLLVVLFACEETIETSSINPKNWSQRKAQVPESDSLVQGKSYLSVYSQIYSNSQRRKHNLTVMVSFRNLSQTDTIYVLAADYYDPKGTLINDYFKHPIYIAPMETTEIIIEEMDARGGTGPYFLIDWIAPPNCPEPLFEGIMSSTMGQQGLSFTTQARRIL